MSTDKLKVAVVSHDIAWGDKEENIISVAELLNRVDKDTDIVVNSELKQIFPTKTGKKPTSLVELLQHVR